MNPFFVGALIILSVWSPIFARTNFETMQKISVGNVTLYHYPRDKEYAENSAKVAVVSLNRISKFLELKKIPKITVLITKNATEFHKLTGGQIPEWGAAAAFPAQSLICLIGGRLLSKVRIEHIMTHELSHILLAQVLGNYSIDKWIDEGFAEVMAESPDLRTRLILFRAFSFGNILDLEDIDNVLTFQRDKAGLAYAQAVSGVKFLIDTYGDGVIPNIAGMIGTGIPRDSAFTRALGIDFYQFQENWVKEMSVRYRWGFLMEVPLLLSILMVTAFLAAVVVVRRRAKLKLQEWEAEESLEQEV